MWLTVLLTGIHQFKGDIYEGVLSVITVIFCGVLLVGTPFSSDALHYIHHNSDPVNVLHITENIV